ncbi:MAG: helix-turn-helix transcriptional regulator, partial [Candidatus Bathyarchaeia archaeon]
SEDEKAIIDEIRRAGKITQDSLRFRLGWSKAKVSRILINLDKMNLIQRERIGKTYNVFLTEERK